MHTQEKKDAFWKRHQEVRKGRMKYRILGWFIYPFINRIKVRKKIKNGTDSKWTLHLWYMMNDDEIDRYGVDYDVRMVEEKGIPKWFASYWFNAWRNSAYNYIQSHPPYDKPIISYKDTEYPIDDIEKDLDAKRVDPLYRAEWIVKDGDIDWEESKVGEGEVWYHPNGDESISLCRYSKAYIREFLLWRFYITYQKGEHHGGTKFDTKFHIDYVERV